MNNMTIGYMYVYFYFSYYLSKYTGIIRKINLFISHDSREFPVVIKYKYITLRVEADNIDLLFNQ